MSNFIEVEVRRHLPSNPWTYSLLDFRQREIGERVREGGRGALLLSEVSPVITLGRRTQGADLLTPSDQLSRIGIEVCSTDRGGLATFHGLGQWVMFPVDRLEALTQDHQGVRKVVEGLLEIAWRVGLHYDPKAEIRSGCEMGVWTSRGKFAAVGVHVERRVLFHGLAVNGFRTPHSFVGLRPCGLDAPVDFLLDPSSNAREEGIADRARESEFLALGNRLVTETFRQFWIG